jgi:GH24 family phage-related lysozyme (muramidase)
MKTLNGLIRRREPVRTVYVLTDRLHRERCVHVTADEITTIVSAWLAQLGAHSVLAEDFARTLREGDWASAHAIAEALSVDVTVAA